MTSKLGLKLGEVLKEGGTDYTQLCPEHQVSFLSKDAPRQCNGGTGSSGARGAAWRDGVGGWGGLQSGDGGRRVLKPSPFGWMLCYRREPD